MGVVRSALAGIPAMRGVGAYMVGDGADVGGLGVEGGIMIFLGGSLGVGATIVGDATTVGEERRLYGESAREEVREMDRLKLRKKEAWLGVDGTGVGPSSIVRILGVPGVGEAGACFFLNMSSEIVTGVL